MSERTTFKQQFDAVAELSRKNTDPALQDAAHTLSMVRRVHEELWAEPPDVDEVAKFLEALLTG
jgi:hypothetical protein